MVKQYDAIVIGGGPGGLTCTALLAKWGLKPLLLEKNEITGGKAVTVERDGFRYDLAPKLQVPMHGPAFATVFRLLGIESEFKPIYEGNGSLSYRSSKADKYKTIITHPDPDPAEVIDLLGLDAQEGERLIAIFADIATMTPEKRITLDDMTFDEYLSQCGDVPKNLYDYFAMHSNASLAEPIDLVAASEQALILQQIALQGGGGYYAGGFGRMLDAIAATIKANGGEIRTKTRVEKINIKDGQVTGVVTEKAEFKAPIVISDAGIQPTVLKLVGEEHFDKSYVNYVKDLVPGWGFTGVKYFLNKPVLKQKLYMMWAHDSWWNMERYTRIKQGHVPEEIIVFAIVPSIFDPTMSRPGKQCLIAGTVCSPNPEAKEIAMLYKKMEEMWDINYPGVMDAVYHKESEGPAEISAATRDHVLKGQGGEAVGLAQIVGQCGKYKPSPRSPVRGLFYVGCDAGGTGVGTHQAAESGINVAHMVLQYHRKKQAAR